MKSATNSAMKSPNNAVARLTLAVLALAVSSTTHADSFVWKISKGENELFLGGTVHVLSTNDYPLPEEFDEAYSQAGTVVFETDITALSSPEFEQLMMAEMMYTDGTTLESQLRPETWERLVGYLAENQVPAFVANTMKPGMIYFLLTAIELQRLGIDQAGVDEHYNEKAITDSKALVALESPEDQLGFITALGSGNAEELILSSLNDVSRLPEMMGSILNAWKQGDEQAMSEILITEMETRYPSLYESLLVERNQQWLPQIVAMLETAEVEVVLVGAAHLAGKDGLLLMLADQGFTVEQL